jgi:uncharacterized RDD family membrane protein YckC
MTIAGHARSDPYREPAEAAGLDGLPARYARYAGVPSRTAALMIDYLVLLLAYLGTSYVVGQAAARSQMDPPAVEALRAVASLIVAALYFAAMEGSPAQATLGKMAVGLQVADVNGRPIGFARALARFFGKLLSAFVLGVGFVMAVFNDRHRALHDVLTGTVVLKLK